MTKRRKPSSAASNPHASARTPRSLSAAHRAHLLDTHTLIWALAAPERLSTRARAALERGENVVSVASYWEILLKTQKGLLQIGDLVSWWKRATDLFYAQILPIRSNHVSAMSNLPPLHKDPFDRILVAQAIAEGLQLVTNDTHVRAYSVLTIW